MKYVELPIIQNTDELDAAIDEGKALPDFQTLPSLLPLGGFMLEKAKDSRPFCWVILFDGIRDEPVALTYEEARERVMRATQE